MAITDGIRQAIARWLAPELRAIRQTTRTYSGAQGGRLTYGWGSSLSSADAEISSSLRPLRQRSRALTRDASFAKRAKTIVVANVIGSGIGLQAQVKTTRGGLNQRINGGIESNWDVWTRAENCHTGGRLDFSSMEQWLMGQVFEAGEVLVREHYYPFGSSSVPYALEVIEAERLVDDLIPASTDPSVRVRMGVEVDGFSRPAAYWLRTVHPGEARYSTADVDRLERVPAQNIIHLAVIDRWPQTRGVPWMHAALRKLNDTDGYSEAEIVRARGAANYMATIETDEEYGTKTETGANEIALEPGVVERLSPGEKLNFHATNSPNPSADPFLRFLLREVAAGIGVSYESLSRDYSQSNYSSSRLALLDDRDLWRIFQLWFIRNFRMRVHRNWLQQAVFARAIPSISIEDYAEEPQRYEAVRFKPRGWSWVDPTSEVEAYKEAVKAGFTTRTDVIAQTANGRDVEDIDEERQQELDRSGQLGLVFDTDPAVFNKPKEAAKPPAPPEPEKGNGKPAEEEEERTGGRVKRIHPRV